MPAPSNTSTGTAVVIAALPYSVTQTVDFGGTTYTVYYKFTPSASGVYGIWAFGDLAVYTPSLNIVNVGGTDIQVGATTVSSLNVPMQYPMTAGTDYYLKIAPNAGNPSPAVLTLALQLAQDTVVPIGSILVPDDTYGFPAACVSSTVDQTMLRFLRGFPTGEDADVLTNGEVLTNDQHSGYLALYDNTLTFVKNVVANSTTDPTNGYLHVNSHGTFWYIGSDVTSKVTTVTQDGVLGGTVWGPLATSSLSGIAASPDNTILYYTGIDLSGVVKRWDLVNNVALSNLAGAIAGYTVSHRNILCLSDGSVVVSYYKNATHDLQVKRYNADGSTAMTKTLAGVDMANGDSGRLAYAIDNPTTFWLWQLVYAASNPSASKFLNVQASDGTTLTTRITTQFETGVTQAAAAVSMVRFGHSESCPFFITRAQASSATNTDPIRVQRRFVLPSETNLFMFLSRLELFCQSGVGLQDGAPDNPVQGADPQVFLRVSRDGGQTWSPELWRSMGQIGEYTHRSFWNRLGRGRNFVCEVTCSDPVFIAWLDAYATIDDGTS